MILIRDIEMNEELISFLKEFKIKQESFSDSENFCFPSLSLYLAAKYDLLFANFMLHPLVLSVKPFFETRTKVEENEIKSLIASVLEFELTSDGCLTSDELKRLIKIHKNFKIVPDEKNNEVSIKSNS